MRDSWLPVAMVALACSLLVMSILVVLIIFDTPKDPPAQISEPYWSSRAEYIIIIPYKPYKGGNENE